jgi:hypothetical protein
VQPEQANPATGRWKGSRVKRLRTGTTPDWRTVGCKDLHHTTYRRVRAIDGTAGAQRGRGVVGRVEWLLGEDLVLCAEFRPAIP